jgi:hypothetical protein
METSECDELPAVSQLGKTGDELLDLLVGQSSSFPIEARRKVVGKHEMRVLSEHSL